MKPYVTITAPAEDQFVERKSEFIGAIAPVETEEQALAFLSQIRAKHKEAAHNCFAYRLKSGLQRCSDDGEPQGTGGLPILDVLEREDVTDVIVVVTRYFGGILLGTGGLVRAYGHGAKIALQAAQRKKMTPAVRIKIKMDYTQYGKINYILPQYTMLIEDTDFAEAVTMTVLFEAEAFERFQKELQELTAATVCADILEECMGEFPILGECL